MGRLDADHAGPVVVRAEPFDAIELDLGLLWPSYDEPGEAAEDEPDEPPSGR